MNRVLLLILAVAWFGGLTPSSRAAAPLSSSEQVQSGTADREAPVPVPAPDEKALQYYRSGNVLWLVDLAWGLLIPALFLVTGFSARIRSWAQRLGRKWFFVIGIYFAVFMVLNFIIDLPLTYYQDFVREHAYGLSTQTAAKWWGDMLKSLAVSLIAGFLFLWVPYLLLKKSPRRWWLYTAMLAVPFLLFAMLITPVWIDPLFNEFGPMKDKALEGRILALAERAGIEGSRVFEVNKSVDTTAVNAYVTGFLNTKRIVLWDTILAKLSEKEVLVVVGHEMAHYVLNHVMTTILFLFLLILLALYLAYRLAGALIDRYQDRFGFDRLSDIASLPLLMLLIGVLSFFLSPIVNAFSRYQEHEADRFALEITRSNHEAATAFVKLQQENLAIPRPGVLYKIWRATHPPIGERIDFCNEYRPWQTGQPLKYQDRFK